MAKLSGAARTAVAKQALLDDARLVIRRRDGSAVQDTVTLLTALLLISQKKGEVR